MIVLYCVEMMVSPGKDVVMLRICVMVLAGRIEVSVRKKVLAGCTEVSVIEKIVVAVPCGKVDVMKKVLAGWIDVSVRVSVS